MQLSRLVLLAMVVLFLAFSAVLYVTDVNGVRAFWPEVILVVSQFAALAASYTVPFVRRFISDLIRAFCFMTAALFVMLAAANGFGSNYALGLLFVIPGLGAGYGAVTRSPRSLATFFGIVCVGAISACLLTAGATASTVLFTISLVCISVLTLFVAAGWLNARERYLASEERYRAVVEEASDGIFMLDPDTFDVLDANRAFCEMLAVSRADLRSVRISDYFERTCGMDQGERSLFDRAANRVECVIHRSDGSNLFGDLKIDRIRHEGGDVLSVVVHDVTSHKEHEERLRKAKEGAEEIARFKSALLANMSHEIRTPLSSILGWTSVLGKEVTDEQREVVRLIERSGKRLHNTLDSVLELAHLQANVKKVSPVRFDLRETVRQAAERSRPEIQQKGLALTIGGNDDPMWVESDPACLQRVLMHLLDNAVKFTHAGRISVKTERRGAEIAVSVTDTGIGIAEDFIPAAFDEFRQQSVGLRRAHEGNGLGLSLARRLTDLLGGRVNVESEQGVGTTITVYLPAGMLSSRRLCA
ncbi:MAG: PAS domain-containing sensor histidine kinase [Rhodothermales bacterium]